MIKFSEFDIQYRLRPSLKAKVLANFIIECTATDDKAKQESNDKSKIKKGFEIKFDSIWILHVDRVSNTQENRASLILTNSEWTITKYIL